MKRTTLRRVSMRRLSELSLYHYRRKQFLLAHPYCQVWLAEHGVQEETAIRQGGRVECGGVTEIIPLSTEIHHKNKRRGADLSEILALTVGHVLADVVSGREWPCRPDS